MNIALIPARGGSKGLPRKNLASLHGKPLIYWTIQAAKMAKSINAVYVSTEDPEIAQVAIQAGASVIDRPIELAQDETSSEPVIKHAIDLLLETGVHADSITLLQPTSPLRNSSHVDQAYSIFYAKKAQCVISVFEPAHSAAKAYKLGKDGTISGLLSADAPYQRRQDLPMTLFPNGAIYIFSSLAFTMNDEIPKDSVYPYIMSSDLSIDIDDENDLRLAEKLMELPHE